jgi:hypothetical protein
LEATDNKRIILVNTFTPGCDKQAPKRWNLQRGFHMTWTNIMTVGVPESIRTEIQNKFFWTNEVSFYRRSWYYFEVNGKQYRNPVYEYLYYSKSLEPEVNVM